MSAAGTMLKLSTMPATAVGDWVTTCAPVDSR